MQTRNRRRKWPWLLVGLAAMVVIAAVLWQNGLLPPGSGSGRAGDADSSRVVGDAGRGGKKEDPERVPVPVELARVERRMIAAFYRAASVIEADRLVDVVPKRSGRIQSLEVEEGDWVRSGQVLAEIENGRERVQLRQAELRLAEQARLLARNEAMLAEELISRQVYDDVKAAHDLAAADRDLAAIALEETIIRAPFAGQVTDRKIVPGQQVAIAAPLFTLADFEPLRIRVYLPETVARKVAEGQAVLVFPEGAADPLPAVVERVSPVVDPATSTVRLTLRIAGRTDRARVGGFVKVRITTDSHTDALAIPKTALVEEGALRSVFAAEADTVRKLEINTGLYDETHVEVLDGLSEGDFVVTLGQGGLRTGSLIEALNGAEVGWSTAGEPDSAAVAAAAQVALTPEGRDADR